MDIEKIRHMWQEKVMEVIHDCISPAKTIDDINHPWGELGRRRLKIAKDFGNNYPTQIEAQTAALLLIEKELSDRFGEEYIKYCQRNPYEARVDLEILLEAKRVAEDAKRGKDASQINKQAVYDVWFRMLSEYKPFLLAKIRRSSDGVSSVVKRSDEELQKFIDEWL